MNVNRFKIDVKIHRIYIKTYKELFESIKLFEQLLLKLFKILSFLSSTFTDQILNEMNNSSSK